MKKKEIHCKVYPTPFIFIIAKTRDEVFKKYAIEWNEVGGCCYHNEKIWIIIHPKQPIDVLVHECDHAVSELWKVLEIKKLKGTDECYAYMMGWLFKKCHKFWKKKKK